MADALEQARMQKSALYARCKEAKAAAMQTRDPEERRRQQDRARILQTMYREACAEVARLDPAAAKKPVKPQTGQMGVRNGLDVLLQSGALWADLEGETFSRLEGQAWNGVEHSTGRMAQMAAELVGGGLQKCTPKQQAYIRAYYANGTAMADIAEDHQVLISSVSRVIQNGLRRIERYITAKLLLRKCVDERGRFDYLTFAASAQVLTQRQRELMFLMLARDTSYLDMSEYIARCPSTVSRTADRVEERLRGLAVELDVNYSAIKVVRSDWEGVTEKELAQRLGLSPKFYYQTVCRGKTVCGIPMLHYAVLRRLRESGDLRLTAAELDCREDYVRRIERRYQHLDDLPEGELEDYCPQKPRRVALPKNPFVAMSGDTILDRIDGATYRKLQQKFGGAACAGT